MMKEKMTRTKQIRLRHNYYMRGTWSVHKAEYVNGKLVYESLIGYSDNKRGARKIKENYLKSKQ